MADRDSARRTIALWLIATAAMTLLMVVIGGITRLTQSGLSITEWQPIEGVLPPLSAAAWQQAFERYQKIPEYQQIHFGMTLDQFKSIFFWEYVHRLVGRATGTVAIVCAIVACWRTERRDWPRHIAVPVLVLLQGVLGWYMVVSGLSVRTSVSQYRLTAHLATALFLYGYCIWQAASLLADDRMAAPRSFRRAAWGVLGLVCVTVLAGGLTAGTKAGLVYNTFPLMDGRLVPTGYFAESPWWLNPFENVTAVQFDHRVLAMTTLAAILGLFLWSLRLDLARRVRRSIGVLAGLAALQVTLGISTLLWAVPVPLAAAHQTGAVLLLTAALVSVHGLRPVAAAAPAAREDARAVPAG
ncbi:MAG TPA: COX15/CtaA family protein [Stellaceae bacterium]|nr:COX15/CtaA family protein [Stellaceae bacterium]